MVPDVESHTGFIQLYVMSQKTVERIYKVKEMPRIQVFFQLKFLRVSSKSPRSSSWYIGLRNASNVPDESKRPKLNAVLQMWSDIGPKSYRQ